MPGFQELLVILVVAALVLGPNRLPKAAADAARLLARFRREAQGAMSELKKQADVEGLGTELRVLRTEMKDTTGLAKRAVRAELRSLTDQPSPLPPSTPVGPTGPEPTTGIAGSDDQPNRPEPNRSEDTA
jgi:sec-independent protein translocase protein TatB